MEAQPASRCASIENAAGRRKHIFLWQMQHARCVLYYVVDQGRRASSAPCFTNRAVGFRTPYRSAGPGSKVEDHVADKGPQSRGHWLESASRLASAQR